MSFKYAVNAAMRELSLIKNVRFYGQSVAYDGAAIYDSLDGVPMNQRIEMPVAEDFQLGYCIGAALTGILPVCIYPRIDFMLLALNQLVNHLDKLPKYGWNPKMILRTTVGKRYPVDPGPQHRQNHTMAFGLMCKSVRVIEVTNAQQVQAAYREAVTSKNSVLVVENPNG